MLANQVETLEKILNLAEKVEFFRKGHERFLAAKAFFTNSDFSESTDQSYLANSTNEIIFDLKFPQIKIRQYQMDCLKRKTKYGEATRFLLDIFFEKELIAKKNANFLKSNFKEKYEMIKTYVLKNYQCTLAQINKSITDKCHSYK